MLAVILPLSSVASPSQIDIALLGRNSQNSQFPFMECLRSINGVKIWLHLYAASWIEPSDSRDRLPRQESGLEQPDEVCEVVAGILHEQPRFEC